MTDEKGLTMQGVGARASGQGTSNTESLTWERTWHNQRVEGPWSRESRSEGRSRMNLSRQTTKDPAEPGQDIRVTRSYGQVFIRAGYVSGLYLQISSSKENGI